MPGVANTKRVKDLMSRDVVSIRTGATVHEAIQLMTENRISALPVVNPANKCVGIISTTDLIDLARDVDEDLESFGEAAEGGNWLVGKLLDGFGHEDISSVMADTPTTIRPEVSLVRAARMMLQKHVHRLPVVDDSHQLIGIISTMDIMKAIANGEERR